MNRKRLLNWGIPALLALLIFTSNFLDTDIFHFGENNFAVWFSLSVFSFACGWLINKTHGWEHGGKLIFAVTVSVTVSGIVLVMFFKEYFSANNMVAENIILYSLRNVLLGATGFFGLAVQHIFSLEPELRALREKLQVYEELGNSVKRESDLTLKDAALKAAKIVQDAENTARAILARKEQVERQMKEFLQIEKELLRKYEDDL